MPLDLIEFPTDDLARARRFWKTLLDVSLDERKERGPGPPDPRGSTPIAQWERRIIGQRTKEALAVKKAQGVRVGRPRTIPKKVVDRIRRERANGKTLAAIADGLNRDGVPTAQGGRCWYPATVKYTLARSA